jgi:hypothetical protein
MLGQKAISWRFKIGTSQLRETTLTENIGLPGWPGVGRGADNTTLKSTLVTKSEQAIAGSLTGRSLCGRPVPIQGCRTNDDHDSNSIHLNNVLFFIRSEVFMIVVATTTSTITIILTIDNLNINPHWRTEGSTVCMVYLGSLSEAQTKQVAFKDWTHSLLSLAYVINCKYK